MFFVPVLKLPKYINIQKLVDPISIKWVYKKSRTEAENCSKLEMDVSSV